MKGLQPCGGLLPWHQKTEETKACSFWTKYAYEMFEGTGPHWIVVISIPGVDPSTFVAIFRSRFAIER